MTKSRLPLLAGRLFLLYMKSWLLSPVNEKILQQASMQPE